MNRARVHIGGRRLLFLAQFFVNRDRALEMAQGAGVVAAHSQRRAEIHHQRGLFGEHGVLAHYGESALQRRNAGRTRAEPRLQFSHRAERMREAQPFVGQLLPQAHGVFGGGKRAFQIANRLAHDG
jgi:hypothetical protein